MPVPNTQPLAVGSIKTGQVVCTTANAGRDGSGTIGTNLMRLYQAGSQGAVIPRAKARHQGAAGTASSAMRLVLYRSSSGDTVKTQIDEVLLPAGAGPSNTVLGAGAIFPIGNYQLGPNESLLVSQTVSESVAYDADQGGDY